MKFISRIDGYGDFDPTARENLHITLIFLGEVADERGDELRSDFTSACSDIDVGEFTCTVSGVGVFPHMNFIRVIWAGAVPEEAFTELHMNFRTRMNGQNEEDFVPHVTLGRLRGIGGREKSELREVLEEESPDFGTFQVKDVRLKRSILTDDGPKYEDLEVCEL